MRSAVKNVKNKVENMFLPREKGELEEVAENRIQRVWFGT
jgi:hypothetical protein